MESIRAADHISDLKETFDNLRRFQVKLNPKKCAFGVTAGRFLGFLVTQRGIEANPEKITAILDMRPPSSKKEIQRLTGRVAALSRFLSKSAERCLPFFKALRKVNHFEWTADCQSAFEGLKTFLSAPPLLSKPVDGETLFLYLAASPEAVSSVLVRLDACGAQKPVYYVSKVLHDAEVRYSKAEKIIFALITSAQRLRPYFQAHPITVLTDQPLRAILTRPDTSGRLAKWAIKLNEFDISFQARPAQKSQILADFLVECTWGDEPAEESPATTSTERSPRSFGSFMQMGPQTLKGAAPASSSPARVARWWNALSVSSFKPPTIKPSMNHCSPVCGSPWS